MKTNSDYHFVIGSFHIKQSKPCQDHVLAGTREDAGIIAVADGCSQQEHTDIGARIITCSSIVTMNEYLANRVLLPTDPRVPEEIKENIRTLSYASRRMMGLKNPHLYATCLYAVVTENGGFVHIIGDGHAILKYKDGRVQSHSIEWQNNTPYYLAYNPRDIERFLENHSKVSNGEKSLCLNIREWSSDGKLSENITYRSAKDGIKGYVTVITPDMLSDGLEYVLICSDGLGSFKNKDSNIPVEEIIKEISSFKNSQGEFVKRRLNRLLSDNQRDGTEPSDDVSCAAICINS